MTTAEFKALYPAFAEIVNDDIQAQIDLFGVLYQGNYGDLADHLTGLYVAHRLVVFVMQTGHGPSQLVTARTVDSLSWKYAEPADGNISEFSSTKYGQEFARLIRMFGMGPSVSGAYRGTL